MATVRTLMVWVNIELCLCSALCIHNLVYRHRNNRESLVSIYGNQARRNIVRVGHIVTRVTWQYGQESGGT